MKKPIPPELLPTLPAWAQWLAQDEDGTWWAYEVEPNQQHNGWYENEVGRIQRLGKADPPSDWQATLQRLNAETSTTTTPSPKTHTPPRC